MFTHFKHLASKQLLLLALLTLLCCFGHTHVVRALAYGRGSYDKSTYSPAAKATKPESTTAADTSAKLTSNASNNSSKVPAEEPAKTGVAAVAAAATSPQGMAVIGITVSTVGLGVLGFMLIHP